MKTDDELSFEEILVLKAELEFCRQLGDLRTAAAIGLQILEAFGMSGLMQKDAFDTCLGRMEPEQFYHIAIGHALGYIEQHQSIGRSP
jgi:hypothetical protein